MNGEPTVRYYKQTEALECTIQAADSSFKSPEKRWVLWDLDNTADETFR